MRTGTYFAAALCAVLCIPLTWYIMKDVEGASWVGILISIFCGLAAGCAIGYVTEYYTSDTYKPTQQLSDATETGAATIIIGGISLGMKSHRRPDTHRRRRRHRQLHRLRRLAGHELRGV